MFLASLPIFSLFAVGEENVLLQYGALGVLALILLGAVAVLWKKLEKRDQELNEKDTIILNLTNARLNDAKENLIKVVEPMNAISTSIQAITSKIMSSKQEVI